jgi:hypothetical protein
VARPARQPFTRIHLEGTMLDAPFVWSLALRFPSLFTGRALHRAALHAAAAQAWERAEGLFERAAGHYRMELEIEALARLRIHQMVTRARAATDPEREAELLLESAQRLARLERIESFDPPFPMIPARELFESGFERGEAARSGGETLRHAA